MSFQNNDSNESQTAGAETGVEMTVASADQAATATEQTAEGLPGESGALQAEGVPPTDVFAPPGEGTGLALLEEEMKPERVHGIIAVLLSLNLKDRKRKGTGAAAKPCGQVRSLANMKGEMSFGQAAAFFAWLNSDLNAEATGVHRVEMALQVCGDPTESKEAQEVMAEMSARAFG